MSNDPIEQPDQPEDMDDADTANGENPDDDRASDQNEDRVGGSPA